ncbi:MULTISPECIES: DMT family transporter [unclassified Vibrio]|uniref:DMT family transporter n=1 Tax=unclassified Vibrio TaxID=2614977 RepID=UPI001361DB90|nr:EamA family transporter [Vibrio sp. V36_P2S2PM302]NAX26064.1 EamA family transporter [Vibrio sp. V38_P2S17PM301]NAX30950.1 EamA family transporter [Vibrio sp. V37_P2S8PM304]
MLGRTPTALALGLLILGNLAASLSDVMVKLLEGSISPLQYMFVRQLFAVLLIAPLWWRQPRAQRRLQQVGVTLTRAHLILIGSGCMMVAITHMTLATANAVFYAAPLLMLPLSIWLLNERPGLGKVLATVIGFIGVLVVLRPSQFHWAALFALGTATTLALFNVLVQKLPADQPVITTLFWTSLLSLPSAALLAWVQWQPLSVDALILVAASAAFVLTYNGLAVMAYQRAPANHIALAEYSGLIFVAVIGWVWFAERLDGVTLLGIALIVLPLMPLRLLRNGIRRPRLFAAAKPTARQTEKHHRTG